MNPNLLPLDELRQRLRWAQENGCPTLTVLAGFLDIGTKELYRFARGDQAAFRDPARRLLTDFFRKFDLGVYVVETKPKCRIIWADAPRPFLRGQVTVGRTGPTLRFKPLPEVMGYEAWRPDDAKLQSSKPTESSKSTVV